MQEIVIEKNQANQRLDKFLHKYMPEAGSGFLYKMLRKKNIVLNGKKAEGNEILKQGDNVKLFFSPDTLAKMRGQKENSVQSKTEEFRNAFQKLGEIEVLYEDDDFLILNKPVGILSQKADPEDISINEWMIGYLLKNKKVTQESLQTFHPSVCNRLDRNTSGIILCGKSLPGSQVLNKMISERDIQKYYHTICVGKMDQVQDLDGYLIKDSKNNTVKISKTKGNDEASYIHTRFVPLALCERASLLEVELITGKTHQIRAHLSSTGHPIAGDPKYGSEAPNNYYRQTYGLKYQLLHARRVVFPTWDGVANGLSGKEVVAEYPKLFNRIKEELFK